MLLVRSKSTTSKWQGQWKHQIVDHPNHQGEWIHPEIDNPKRPNVAVNQDSLLRLSKFDRFISDLCYRFLPLQSPSCSIPQNISVCPEHTCSSAPC
ncbi:uncharacterized protein LOC144281958 isoform X2 [Canis aureus]